MLRNPPQRKARNAGGNFVNERNRRMTIKEFYHRVELNGGFDREIDEWKIIDIHQIPKTLSEQNEIDFYNALRVLKIIKLYCGLLLF